MTGLFYIGSLTAIVVFYVHYTGAQAGDCKLNEFFISFNMIICVILSVVSILPKVQDHVPHSGLLQSSCITLYILYLTWSAMSNGPYQECKPDLDSLFNNSTATTTPSPPTGNAPQTGKFDTQSIIGKSKLFLYTSLCSRNFQNVKLRLDFLEIWSFYRHSAFTWN